MPCAKNASRYPYIWSTASNFRDKSNRLTLFVLLLRNNISQMVYKHAISTIVPARNVRLPGEDEEGVEGEQPAAPAAETAARPSTDPLY